MRDTELVPALDALAAELTAAGVEASTDPTKIPVPGAWVTVENLNPERLCGDFTVTAAIYLIARDTGHTPALADLTVMLDRTSEVLPALTTAQPDSVSLPGFTGPLPALRTTAQIGD